MRFKTTAIPTCRAGTRKALIGALVTCAYMGVMAGCAATATDRTAASQAAPEALTAEAVNTEHRHAQTSNDLAPHALRMDEQTRQQQMLEEEWGVEVVAIRPSAAGYVLDFRYRILDAEKAAPLLDRRIKPELVVAKSGAVLKVPVPPKVGALRQSSKNVKADRNYFILFSNPGKHVSSGDKVSVVIGDFRADDLTVQ